MPKIIGSASGNNLKITIPERGEKNWDELIENSCFTPISNHSHTGNGDGAKIDTDALEDNAVTTDKITDANVTEAKLESAVQTKLSNVSTNTSNISTNTSNISTNTSSISNLSIPSVISDLSNVSSTTPSSGQTLSWNGSAWAPATSSGGGGSSNVVTIASQSDATNYSNTSGDIIVVSGHSGAIDFPNAISQSVIYIAGSHAITFSGALNGCVIKSAASSTLTLEEGLFSSILTHNGSSVNIGPAASNRFISRSRIICMSVFCDTSGNGELHFNRSFINCDKFSTFGSGTQQDGKIQIKEGTIVETDNTNLIASDITVNAHATFRITDRSNGVIKDENGVTLLDHSSTTSLFKVPFEVADNMVKPLVPVAGRYNISSDVTVDTSSNDTLNVNWDTVQQQSGGLSLSGGKVVVPYSGWYAMTAGIYVTGLDNATDDASVRWRISVENTSRSISEESQISGSSTNMSDTNSMIFYCEAGDVIGAYIQERNDSDNSILLSSYADGTFLTVHMIK